MTQLQYWVGVDQDMHEKSGVTLSHFIYYGISGFLEILLFIPFLLTLILGPISLILRWRAKRVSKGHKRRRTLSRIRRAIYRLIFVASFCMMWSSLFLLFILRTEIIKDAGGDTSEMEWSFGQLLALATWVPLLVEFIYVLCCKSTLSYEYYALNFTNIS